MTIFISDECLNNIVWSDCPWLYPGFLTDEVKRSNQTLGNCFRPYNFFFNLHTQLFFLSSLNPGGISIQTSLLRSPSRNAFFTSNWWRGQSLLTAMESRTRIVLSFVIKANVSWWSTPYVCVNPLTIDLVLYLSMFSSILCFTLKIYLHPIVDFPIGNFVKFRGSIFLESSNLLLHGCLPVWML